VARPGEPHEIIASEEDPLGIYFWWYTLVPSHIGGSDPVGRLLQAFIESQRWVSDRVPAMQTTLGLLTLEITRREAGYPLIIQGLVTKLLLDTARAVTDVPFSAPERPTVNPDEDVVHQITRYLHDNYSRPIQVRDVAAQVHLSERHTNRLFRRVMGLPIKDYLTVYRLKIAAQLLLNRNLTITEIAHATGYHDVRYFIALFRHRTGLTPAAFRRRGGTAFL
ncbi:MAG: AraC family transcriptional regulator, partial [Anaerolineae bacterium]|nr:AraC family transcriptional regulator [Anaerolineae bacterium]